MPDAVPPRASKLPCIEILPEVPPLSLVLIVILPPAIPPPPVVSMFLPEAKVKLPAKLL